MENREVINVLLHHKEAFEISGKTADAIDLAVSALKFKENYDKFWEEVKTAGKSGKETEIHHSGRVFRIREVAQ